MKLGAVFDLNHANIVAYVTSRSVGPPRVRKADLVEFLYALAQNGDRQLISERGYQRWADSISAIAASAASATLESAEVADREALPGSTVERLLEGLRSHFSNYAIFALAVGGGEELRKKAIALARARLYGQLLVLIPEYEAARRNFEVLDPIPAFSLALHCAMSWPGIVFWTSSGAAAFASLNQVEELRDQIEGALRLDRTRPFPFPFPSFAGAVDSVLRKWSITKAVRYRRLLHLSDLHFGTRDASENQGLLDAELRGVVKSVDRVVITGDLFDSPKKDFATLFTTFRNSITHLAGGLEPIVITGNHDQRMIGLFGDSYREVALIGSTKVIVEDACKMVFICFNSSVSGSFARGRITKSQFRLLGAEYRTLTQARPELANYLPIVLVHHHPFSFDVKPETWVQRALSAVGLRDEAFLEMVDAADLHRWCLDWKVKTILHGHKHKARYIERRVSSGTDEMALTAIGCGSSLGAEGSPLSYNVLDWDPPSQRWVASFFESVNGGAFRETVASVSPAPPSE